MLPGRDAWTLRQGERHDGKRGRKPAPRWGGGGGERIKPTTKSTAATY